MSAVTDQLREDIERAWHRPHHEATVLEYIERPEYGTAIAFYRVDYVGTNYSVVRVKVYQERGGGYDTQVKVLKGDIMETVR